MLYSCMLDIDVLFLVWKRVEQYVPPSPPPYEQLHLLILEYSC